MLDLKKILKIKEIFNYSVSRIVGFERGRFLKNVFVHRLVVVTFMFLIGLTHSAQAEEYREIEIKDGGSISGKVFLKGEVPSPRVFHLVLYPFEYFCKKVSDGNDNRLLSEFNVNPEGALQDVVIVVQGVKAGKVFPTPEGVIHATDCVFHPFVSVVKNHQTIKVINDDPVVHNIQVYESERGKTIFNSPLPIKSEESGQLDFEPKMHSSQWICGMHEFMQNWAYRIENPYYAISNADGSFQIDQIPSGNYTVTAWHAHMKVAEKKVAIVPGKNSPVNFEFNSQEVIYPEYEQQLKGRIQHRGKAENYSP
jgi:polysaccharide lyase family 4-like protein